MTLREITAMLTSMVLLGCGLTHKRSDRAPPENPPPVSDPSPDLIADVSQELTGNVVAAQGYNSLLGPRSFESHEVCATPAPLRSLAGSEAVEFSVTSGLAASEPAVVRLGTKLTIPTIFDRNAAGKRDELETARALTAGTQESVLRSAKELAVVVKVTKSHPMASLEKLSISQTTKARFADRPADFYLKCGDSFVSALQEGLKITGVLRCESRSIERKAELIRELSEFGTEFAGAEAVQAQLDRLLSAADGPCRFEVNTTMAPEILPTLTVKTFVKRSLEQLEQAGREAVVPISFAIMPYLAILDVELRDQILSHIDLEQTQAKQFLAEKSAEITAAREELERLLGGPTYDQALAEQQLNTLATALHATEACATGPGNSDACSKRTQE